MDISEKVQDRKIQDRKKYCYSVKKMYDIIEEREKEVFSNYDNKDDELELRLILRFFSIDMPYVQEEIAADDKMEYILNLSNVMSRNIILKDEWWKNDSMPIICVTKSDRKERALIPGRFGGLYYFDKVTGKRIKVNARNAKEFADEAVCFYAPFPENGMTAMDFFLHIFKTLPFADYAVLILTVCIVTLLGLVLPEVNSYIFNFVIPSGQKGDIPFVFALLFGVVISTALFELFRSMWIARIGDRIRNTAEAAMWNRLLNLPADFFKKHDSAELTDCMMMVGQICDKITGSILPIVLSTVFSVVYLVQVGSFSTKLLLPAFLILFVMLSFSLLDSYLMVRMNRKKNKASIDISNMVYQLLSSVGLLKVNGAEARAFEQWGKLYSDKLKIKPAFPVKFAESINVLISLGGSILLYKVVYKNGISASIFISFQVAFGFLTGALMELSGIVAQMAYILPAVKMIEPLLKEAPEKNSRKKKISKLSGKIDITNVSFSYSKDMDDVLHNLNLSIKPGEYVALAGPSGCGKSTLFRLLLGFEKPQMGAVYYDDMDMEDLEYQSIRKRIGTVLQAGQLFSGDIYSNIALCKPNLTLDEAWEAAACAGCDKDIEAMPMGMFTMVSDGGGTISGGQKQRILIARALAMNPDIIFFDEATSALDNVTQKKVVESLAEKNVTRVVIAHRLSTIKNCDRIIYLDKGSVCEEGTYEELMQKKGKFYELAKYQMV